MQDRLGLGSKRAVIFVLSWDGVVGLHGMKYNELREATFSCLFLFFFTPSFPWRCRQEKRSMKQLWNSYSV